jgi:hypothetical protein
LFVRARELAGNKGTLFSDVLTGKGHNPSGLTRMENRCFGIPDSMRPALSGDPVPIIEDDESA